MGGRTRRTAEHVLRRHRRERAHLLDIFDGLEGIERLHRVGRERADREGVEGLQHADRAGQRDAHVDHQRVVDVVGRVLGLEHVDQVVRVLQLVVLDALGETRRVHRDLQEHRHRRRGVHAGQRAEELERLRGGIRGRAGDRLRDSHHRISHDVILRLRLRLRADEHHVVVLEPLARRRLVLQRQSVREAALEQRQSVHRRRRGRHRRRR